MKIAFLTPYTPSPIRPRPFRFLETLAKNGHVVALFAVWTDSSERDSLRRLEDLGIRVTATRLTRQRSLWNSIRGLFSHIPLQARYSWEPHLAAQWIKGIRESDFEILHVEHLRGAQYGLHIQNALPATTPIVWDSVDCISGLFQRASENSASLKHRFITRVEYPRTRAYEAKLLRTFQETIVVSESERRALLALPNTTNLSAQEHIHIVPTGVDTDSFVRQSDMREPATLIFTGKMSYHANLTAAYFLLNEIMPRVWSQRPDVRVMIVGAEPPAKLQALAAAQQGRAIVTGMVPDIQPYLERATIAVAPIVYGAGIQVKILEAFAMQTPVVATSVAAVPLEARDEQELLTAADAATFAAQILRLLDSPTLQQTLTKNGRRFVEDNFSIHSCVNRLERVYHTALARTLANGMGTHVRN